MAVVLNRGLNRCSGLATRQVHEGSTGIELERVDCLFCRGREFDAVVETPDYETRLGGVFRVVCCKNCGLAFTNPRPTVSSIAQFYSSDYAPHQGHACNTNWRGRWRQRLEKAVLRSRFGYPPQPADAWNRTLALLGQMCLRGRRRRATWLPYGGSGELLDFGCGAAQFLRRMRHYGWSVQGLDVSAAVGAKVERATGIRVHVGSLPHPEIRPNSFDAITMWSSLEHVHDPCSVIRAAHEALRPGGILLVYVPSLASWSFRVFREAWIGLDLPRHLVHFTPQTLTCLLQDDGLRIRTLQQIGRNGWMRRSARRELETSRRHGWARACQWKPLALSISRWTELAGQAESILVLAEKGSGVSVQESRVRVQELNASARS